MSMTGWLTTGWGSPLGLMRRVPPTARYSNPRRMVSLGTVRLALAVPVASASNVASASRYSRGTITTGIGPTGTVRLVSAMPLRIWMARRAENLAPALMRTLTLASYSMVTLRCMSFNETGRLESWVDRSSANRTDGSTYA